MLDDHLFPLGSLLPLPLLRRLHGVDGARPAEVGLTGAVLIVDISRYTALVEGLSHRGQAGLERIPQLLSQSYSMCVKLITARNGQVIRFTGDSIVVFWSDEVIGSVEAVAQAVACAEEICATSHNDDTDASTQSAFHAGVGHGDFRIAAIGGIPNWNLVVGGHAFEQATKSLERAEPREVVWSPVSDAQVNGRAARQPEHMEPPQRPTFTEPSEDWLKGFLPPHTIRHLTTALEQQDQGVSGILGTGSEVRPISILFGRITGVPETGGASALRFHPLCRQIQSVLAAHDGPAPEFFLNESGLDLLAVFGESGAFRRDDPLRALEQANAISALARELDLKASLCITTGDSLYHFVGSPAHFSLMLFGQPINRAARLMARASEEVLCDSQTQRLAREHFQFAATGTLQLTGMGEIVPVFQPLETRQSVSVHSDMIGRSAELTFLEDAYRAVNTGSKRLVAILGEPGIGKSTLIKAFASAVHASGAAISIARAERDDQRTSLLVWRQILHAISGLPSSGSGDAVFEAIRNRLDDQSGLILRLPLLSDVLDIAVPDTEGTVHLKGAHRADATMRLIADVIGALMPRPFAIVLEDCQWLDSASWRLLEWVMGSLDSILVVLCVRVGEMPDEIRALQNRSYAVDVPLKPSDTNLVQHFRQIQLTELDEASMRQLISRTLDNIPVHDEIGRRIIALAGGNPLFVEEIALSLKSEGLISVRDGRWQSLQPLEDLVYFEGVEKVIRERMDQLDGPSRDVLTTASVTGRSFDTRTLEALLGFDVDKSIRHLVAAQLITRKSDMTRYEFRHEQIRDVAYNSIASDKRRNLHGALASWLESEHPGGTSSEIAALVQHFEAAGKHDHAVRYADIAATNALRSGAYREVEAFLSICLENEPPRSRLTEQEKFRSVRWRRQLAEAHYGRGDIRAQGIAIRDALDFAGQKVPEGSLATSAILVGRGLRILARQALPVSKDYPGDTDTARWDSEIARCLNQAAIVDYFQLRFSRGMCNLLGAVIRAENTGISVETVMSNCQLGSGLGILGWRSMNARLMNRAEQVALQLGDPSLQSHVCTVDALWRLGFCEWDMVDKRLDQAQSLALQSGDQLRWCNAQGIRFWSQYYRGDLGALEETTRMLLLRAQNAGNIQQEIWALRCKGLCLLHIERPREAVDVLRLTRSGMSGSVDLAAQISTLGALALALTRTGRFAEGYDTAIETLRLLEDMRRPSSHSVVVGISSVLEVLLSGRETGLSDDREEWRNQERTALNKLERYSKVFALGTAQLGMWRGKYNWLNGKRQDAMSEWKTAHRWAKAHQLRKDAALIDAEIRRRQTL